MTHRRYGQCYESESLPLAWTAPRSGRRMST